MTPVFYGVCLSAQERVVQIPTRSRPQLWPAPLVRASASRRTPPPSLLDGWAGQRAAQLAPSPSAPRSVPLSPNAQLKPAGRTTSRNSTRLFSKVAAPIRGGPFLPLLMLERLSILTPMNRLSIERRAAAIRSLVEGWADSVELNFKQKGQHLSPEQLWLAREVAAFLDTGTARSGRQDKE